MAAEPIVATHDRKAAVRAGRVLHLEKAQLARETMPGEVTADAGWIASGLSA
jgi:hypothetical protein